MAPPSATPIGPLPNIHSSTPTPAHAPRATPSGISCAIPDDIVLQIIPFLSFKDALSLSLASKHLNILAPPRITTLVCNKLETVVPMHEYYVRSDDGKARALFLRSLKIGFEAVGSPDNKAYINGKCNNRIHNDMIFKVIGLAKELRYLHLEYFLGCFGYLPMSSSFSLRCSALAALTHLTHLHLSYVGGNNLVIPFSEAGNVLKSVRLTRWGYDEDLISLGNALSEMAHVEKLVLEDIQFIPQRVQSQRDADKAMKYAVKELVLVDVHLGVTPAQLIRMMPELHTLRIGAEHGYYGPCFDPSDATPCPAPAPSLRLLSVLDAHQCCSERLPWQPDALFAILTRPNNNDLVRALNVCDARSLVGLRLRFSQVVADVWHAIMEYAPQLAWLELESIHDDGHFSVLAKLDAVVSESSTPCLESLQCLTILFPRRGPDVDPSGSSADEKRMEDFLWSASARLPRLEYAGMARVDEDRLGHTLDDDYAGSCAPWKWWIVDRVDPDEDDIIYPISTYMGERVREYVRAADESAMEEFYERFEPPFDWFIASKGSCLDI